MNELNKLELTLLNGLSVKYPSLKSHIDNLKVAQRKSTGTGLIVTFEYTNSEVELEDINALFNNEENIEIKKLKRGLSYVIDITAGQIEYLEFSTYDEKRDGEFGDYTIVDKLAR